MVLEFPTSRGIFNGVIKYLSKNNQTNQLGIKSSGKFGPTYVNADNLFAEKEPRFYTEKNSKYGQWIKIWFRNNFVLDIEGYSMKCVVYTECAKYWTFSVSSDGFKWKTIHRGSSTVSLDGNIYKAQAKAIKYIKWTMTGPGNKGRDYVLMGYLDFYGKYYYRFPFTALKTKFLPVKILLILGIVIK